MDGNGRTSIRCQRRQRRERDGGDELIGGDAANVHGNLAEDLGLEYHFLLGHWLYSLSSSFLAISIYAGHDKDGWGCVVLSVLSVTILSCMTLRYDPVSESEREVKRFLLHFKGMGLAQIKAHQVGPYGNGIWDFFSFSACGFFCFIPYFNIKFYSLN